jgi:D-alanyl-D-alanine carboxypeptidase
MTPSESWTAGAIVATASEAAAFLDGLCAGALPPDQYLACMIEPAEQLDRHRGRGLGVVRLGFGTGDMAYGHQGGAPGIRYPAS